MDFYLKGMNALTPVAIIKILIKHLDIYRKYFLESKIYKEIARLALGRARELVAAGLSPEEAATLACRGAWARWQEWVRAVLSGERSILRDLITSPQEAAEVMRQASVAASSAASAATRSRTTPGARPWRPKRSSAGCRAISATSPWAPRPKAPLIVSSIGERTPK